MLITGSDTLVSSAGAVQCVNTADSRETAQIAALEVNYVNTRDGVLFVRSVTHIVTSNTSSLIASGRP